MVENSLDFRIVNSGSLLLHNLISIFKCLLINKKSENVDLNINNQTGIIRSKVF